MAQQKRQPGNAKEKRNSWARGNGSYSFRGELRHGISMRKKELARKVRHNKDYLKSEDYKRLDGAGYKRSVRSINMADFS